MQLKSLRFGVYREQVALQSPRSELSARQYRRKMDKLYQMAKPVADELDASLMKEGLAPGFGEKDKLRMSLEIYEPKVRLIRLTADNWETQKQVVHCLKVLGAEERQRTTGPLGGEIVFIFKNVAIQLWNQASIDFATKAAKLAGRLNKHKDSL